MMNVDKTVINQEVPLSHVPPGRRDRRALLQGGEVEFLSHAGRELGHLYLLPSDLRREMRRSRTFDSGFVSRCLTLCLWAEDRGSHSRLEMFIAGFLRKMVFYYFAEQKYG